VGDEEDRSWATSVADDRTEEPFDMATERLQREDISEGAGRPAERERQ
jgi:hypothetical protein